MQGPRRPAVLFVHGPRQVGGDSTVMLRTVDHLDGLQFAPIVIASPGGDAWHQFEAMSARKPFPLIKCDMGVENAGGGAAAVGLVRAWIVLLWTIIRWRIAVVYTMDRTRAALLAVAAARLLRRGLVWHAHCPWTRWGARVVNAADRVAVISEYIRKEYEQHGVPPHKLRVVYNGVDIDRYAVTTDRNGVRERLGITDDQLLVLLPGRLSRYKGQMELLEALPIILRQHPRVRCVFAGYDASLQDPLDLGDLARGDGASLGQILTERAIGLGVAEQLQLLGPTSNMAELYAAADVVVVPSWAEPFGLVVVEAMAAGRPVVGFDAGALPEIIVNHETGLLVPLRDVAALANAVSQLLGDTHLRTRMGQAAQARARSFFAGQRYYREIQSLLLEAAPGRARPHDSSIGDQAGALA